MIFSFLTVCHRSRICCPRARGWPRERRFSNLSFRREHRCRDRHGSDWHQTIIVDIRSWSIMIWIIEIYHWSEKSCSNLDICTRIITCYPSRTEYAGRGSAAYLVGRGWWRHLPSDRGPFGYCLDIYLHVVPYCITWVIILFKVGARTRINPVIYSSIVSDVCFNDF